MFCFWLSLTSGQWPPGSLVKDERYRFWQKTFCWNIETLLSAVGAVVAIFTAESTQLVNRQHGAVKQKQLIFMVIVWRMQMQSSDLNPPFPPQYIFRQACSVLVSDSVFVKLNQHKYKYWDGNAVYIYLAQVLETRITKKDGEWQQCVRSEKLRLMGWVRWVGGGRVVDRPTQLIHIGIFITYKY